VHWHHKIFLRKKSLLSSGGAQNSFLMEEMGIVGAQESKDEQIAFKIDF
jgi:hypothetical protein